MIVPSAPLMWNASRAPSFCRLHRARHCGRLAARGDPLLLFRFAPAQEVACERYRIPLVAELPALVQAARERLAART
ncbi:MAG: hypothetical protein ABI321_08045 [Polyangia bacterium]